MDCVGHAGFLQPRPDRVVVGHARRLIAVGGRDGAGHGDDHSGAHREHSVEFGNRQLRIGQREKGDGVDTSVAAVETPVLIEPAVECGEGRVEGGDVVLQRLLHAHSLCGEQEHGLQPLFVHQREAGVAVAVSRVLRDGSQVAEHLPEVHVAGLVLPPEIVLEAARRGDGVEGWVGDELVDSAAHEEALFSVDLRPLHTSLLHLGIDVANEGVFGLVVMVVGVEREKRKLGHVARVRTVFGRREIAAVVMSGHH